MSLYTSAKVFHLLADKLPIGSPEHFDVVRWSVEMGAVGVANQRQLHFNMYAPASPDLQVMQSWPETAWDPEQPLIGAKYGVVWLCLSDLHAGANGSDLVIAVALVGKTLFASVTLSSTMRHIAREDGEDENAMQVFVLSVLNHYRSLRALRYADDVTRAAREDLGWASQKQKCTDRDIRMVLGGRVYDLKNEGDNLALKVLGAVASTDDPKRRKKLTGHRLAQYMAGGAAIAADQMPLGWGHRLDEHGRQVREEKKGIAVAAEEGAVEALQQLYGTAADGARWTEIADVALALEAEGKLRRRAHASVGTTFADSAGDPSAMYNAVKQLFVRGNTRPSAVPSPASIEAYEAGADPADLFDVETRLFIAKVELVRTGRYLRRLNNDIRGRGVVLNGMPVTYADDNDEYGWWDVLSAPWPWPVDPDTHQPLERFGLTDEVCRKVGGRLLRELRGEPSATGGRAHNRQTVRILRNFGTWFAMPWESPVYYGDEPTEVGVEARQNNSGKENAILLFRGASVGEGGRSGQRRGMSWLGKNERKPHHIAGTICMRELTASVRAHLQHALQDLAVCELATVREATPQEADQQVRQRRLDAKLHGLEQKVLTARKDAEGLRTMAGRKAGANDFEGADRYDGLAAEKEASAELISSDLQDIKDELAALTDPSRVSVEGDREDAVDLTIGAYLVAGLARAVGTGGRGPDTVANLADDVLVEWRLLPNAEEVVWHCTALLPLRAGGHLRLPLSGTIRNVRGRAGKAIASPGIVARYVFEEGRDLDEVADLLEVTRKTLVTQRVMPYLRDRGVLSRGAKNALVDHPIPTAQRIVFSRISGCDTGASQVWPDAVADHVVSVYLDPTLAWGDAACPDDIRLQQRLAATLTSGAASNVTVTQAALMLGVEEYMVRRWVVPVNRTGGGFIRPRYFRYVPGSDKQWVGLVSCPHGRCSGQASHVVLLPEVAASGYGVLCPRCGRAPQTDDPRWARLPFPGSYLQTYNNARATVPLRLAAQTGRTTPAAALELRG